MKNKIVNNLLYGSYSLILHISLIELFVVGREAETGPIMVNSQINIVRGTILNEDIVLAEMVQQEESEQKELLAEEDRQKKVDARLKATREELIRNEKELLDQRERSNIEGQRRNLVVRQEEEKIRKLEIVKEALKQKVRQARIEEGVRKQKLVEEQKIREKNRLKAEEEEVRKQKLVESQRIVRERLAEEDRQAREKRKAEIRKVVNQYSLIIKQRIKGHWIRPDNTEGLQATLQLSISPRGYIEQIIVEKSSGNTIFDRSVGSAVYKAAPLPQPTDPEVAGKLRNLNLHFN